ncbi:hypothetical protein GLYMA_01G177066v4 [Glycine max]|nr:hypothetical protein GLYMA_01G177066v4 [Glycine max]KAH1163643.1 hypothetical protein GYH30_001926 [Glycine max]
MQSMVEGRQLLHVIPFVQDFMENMEGSENGEILIFAQRYLVERVKNENKVFTIPVASGDAVIAGTDGLFDNLYNSEITGVVVHAIRAQKIAALARQRALSKSSRTPFSTAAQKAGFCYYGGKLDDITVVVSYISGSVSE